MSFEFADAANASVAQRLVDRIHSFFWNSLSLGVEKGSGGREFEETRRRKEVQSRFQVNMIKDDGTVIHFNNPKVQASVPANTFAIVGHAENKQITEMLPGILNQLGAESLTHLKRLANNVTQGSFPAAPDAAAAADDDDDDVPELVGDFDEPSKQEAKVDKKENTQPA